jgi:hypothetical protein
MLLMVLVLSFTEPTFGLVLFLWAYGRSDTTEDGEFKLRTPAGFPLGLEFVVARICRLGVNHVEFWTTTKTT